METTENKVQPIDADEQNENGTWRVSPTRPVKRSFCIAGHRTSISLENVFWEALREIAAIEGRSLASLVAEIDRKRGDAGLSGAVRVYVLDYYRAQAATSDYHDKQTD